MQNVDVTGNRPCSRASIVAGMWFAAWCHFLLHAFLLKHKITLSYLFWQIFDLDMSLVRYKFHHPLTTPFLLYSSKTDDPIPWLHVIRRDGQPAGRDANPDLPAHGQPAAQPQQHGSHQLHQQTTDGTRKRVSFQQVPHASEKDRDSVRAATKRDASEDLVPEPKDETEEEDKGGAYSVAWRGRGTTVARPRRVQWEQSRVHISDRLNVTFVESG